VTVIQPRILTVSVGPPGSTGRLWDQRLYIKAEIDRVVGSSPNKARIQIYNLAPASLVYLEQPGHVLQVQIGSPTPSTVFYGELRKSGVKTEVQHPNQVTTLEAKDGLTPIRDGYFTGSYPAGTTRTQIRTDALAASAVPLGYVAPLPERTYQAPVIFAAPLREVLDELYSGEPAAWSLQGGAFTLILDDVPRVGNAPVISAATGMIGSPKRATKGISVKWSNVGAVSPGTGFGLTSRLISGNYKAASVKTRADTELLWEDEIVGTVLK
jgi:hypothetical protein